MAITIPNTFVAGTKIEATPMNANFAETANAVDKRGDTLTGNLGANAGITVDGVDVSTIPNTSGTFNPLFAQVVIGTADTNGIRLDLESGTLAVREGDDSAYGPLITSVVNLPSTGSINFASSDVTVTHSTNTLTFAGASSGYIFNDGNVGLGVTPSAWDSTRRVLQIGGSGSLWTNTSGNGFLFLLNNAYYDGTNYKYLHTDEASYYAQTTAGAHSFATAASGTAGNNVTFTERFHIDNSGNVGIGVTPGAVKLDIVGSTDVIRVASNATNATTKESKWLLRHYTNAEEDVMFAYVYSTSTANEIYLGGGASAQNAATQISFLTAANNTTVSGTERMRIASSGIVTSYNYIIVNHPTNDAYVEFQKAGTRASIFGNTAAFTGVDGAVVYAPSGNAVNIYAGGSERMRITSGGNVAIAATAKLYLDGVAGTGDTYFEEVSANAPRIVTGGTESMRWTSTYVEARLNLIPSSDNTLTCGANGNRWSAVWAANGTIQTSDRTLKRDISADTLGLDFVQRLRPVSFTMNDEADGARRHGLIAQEVIDAADGQSLLGILTGEKDGEYGLNYAGFVPALIAAIQQQQTEINALKARIH